METRLPVNHYLHLREQGESHEKALAHSVQRYGILPTELLPALYESKRHHLAVAALLPDEPPRKVENYAVQSRSASLRPHPTHDPSHPLSNGRAPQGYGSAL